MQNMSGNLLLAPSSAQDLTCKRRRGRRLEHKVADSLCLHTNSYPPRRTLLHAVKLAHV